jgi:hypothetical protein
MVTAADVRPLRRADAPKPRRIAARLTTRAFLVFALTVLPLLLPSDGYLSAARKDLILGYAVGSEGFRLGAWEIQALSQKATDLVLRPGDDLSPQGQHDLVRTYFGTVGSTDQLAAEIKQIYADPNETNPPATAARAQAELDRLQAEQERRRPSVERILQRQIGSTLETVDLTTVRIIWPPVLLQFTDSPDLLIVSPRDRIVMETSDLLAPGQSVANMERIEAQVQSQLGVSALVDGTGGLATYPTMIINTPDLGWVLDTIAHEWMHTYLVFYPLGQHYFDNGETRTLNETTASIVGDELGRLALERYYPELVPSRVARSKIAGTASELSPTPPASPLDYGATMRETRLHVDKLLSQGDVEEAEAYMETQRRVFVANGYSLRKLNQAFFAFHGSYAIGPAATDPIGDKLRALRAHSASLRDFVTTISRIATVVELDAALARTS